MKSANIDEFETQLNRRPIDQQALIDSYHSNPDLQSYMFTLTTACVVSISDKLDEVLQVLNDVVKDGNNNQLTPTMLARYFNIKPELLKHYSYRESKLWYKDQILDGETDQVVSLSIELEQEFGNKHIPLGVLLSGMKRYFISRQKVDNYVHDFLEMQCEDYLADYKTKPKTRVPLKFVRECCSELNVSNKQLRFIMSELGYHEVKDANKSVFFTKVISND